MAENRYRRAVRSLVADRYYLLTEIGTGGMGTVWRGRDRHTGQAVAVKLLHPHLRRDPVYVARFRREADLATRLDSRHIVQILNYGVDDGEPYIVMEFIEGQTLAELLRPGPLAPAAAAHIGVQVARALEEAHDKGVIHRDIKPGNVLIQSDGEIKVTDFGIARSEDSDTSSETNQIGAASYMAPERFSPQRFGAVDARTDIYSLGVMLYEMLTGYPPFEGDTYELLHAILDEEPANLADLRADLDPRLTILIQRSLAKQTAERPATAAEVRLALQPLADASQLHVGRSRSSLLGKLTSVVTLPFRVFRPRRRAHRRAAKAESRAPLLLAGAVTVIGLAALIAAGYLLMGRSGEDATDQVSGPTPAAMATITLGPAITTVRCLDGPAPLGQALGRCPAAKVTYSATCPLGQACTSGVDSAGAPVISANDATVALVDERGSLVIARQDGSVVQRLTNRGQIEQPAWSPDGRYLAYVTAQLIQAGDAGQSALYATQLRIVEPQNPSNDWVVVSATQRQGVDEALRRLITWPQWTADGRAILFLWPPSQEAGDAIFQVDLPLQDKALDAAKVLKESPPGDSYAVSPLRRVALTPDAFGYAKGSLGSFAVAQDGRLFVQFCDSKAPARQCGLGSFDGRSAKVVVPLTKDGFLDGPTLVGATDDLYEYAFSAGNRDQLVHVHLAAGQTDKVIDVSRDVAYRGPFLTPLALTDDGKSLLIETTARTLSLVDLSNGQQKPWGKGHAPAWFVAGRATDAPLLMPTELWTPAGPAPTPTAPTPVVPTPMTVSVEVREGGKALSGAQVVALVGTTECATGATDASGRLQLVVPSGGAPTSCATRGATVTFRVDGKAVPNQVTFAPFASAQAPINLP